MIYTKKVIWEYKNSTDVRTIDALVYNCAQTNEKDDNGNRKEEYKVSALPLKSVEQTYDDFKTYSEKKRRDTVRIVVTGIQRRIQIGTRSTPFYFLAFAAMIPLGLIGFVAQSKDLIKYHREEKEGRRL